MDAVTYSSEIVQAELAHWNFVKVDVVVHGGVQSYLGANGLPHAVLMTAEGELHSRLPGFMEPEELVEALRRARNSAQPD